MTTYLEQLRTEMAKPESNTRRRVQFGQVDPIALMRAMGELDYVTSECVIAIPAGMLTTYKHAWPPYFDPVTNYAVLKTGLIGRLLDMPVVTDAYLPFAERFIKEPALVSFDYPVTEQHTPLVTVDLHAVAHQLQQTAAAVGCQLDVLRGTENIGKGMLVYLRER